MVGWRGIFFSLTLGWLVSLLAGRSSTFVLYSTMLRFIYVFIIRKEGQLGKSGLGYLSAKGLHSLSEDPAYLSPFLFYCSWAGANGHIYMYILAAGTLPLDIEVMARKERSYGHQIAVERTG